MNHEQVKEFALVHFPSIESLTSLSPAELNILADTVKEAAKHGLTSQEAVEKADTVRDIGAEIEAEYLAAIENAETIDDLVEIGLTLKENGVSTESLREAYQARREALLPQVESAPVTEPGDPSPVPDYLKRIAAAPNKDALHAIAAELNQNGISDERLGKAFTNRHRELATVMPTEQPDLMHVERPIDERMPL